MQKNAFLNEVSKELARFDNRLSGWFRCPTCLRDLPVDNFRSSDEGKAFNEEHIIPDSVGGVQTTFLCKKCNSSFGHMQTKWLVEWIELNEGGAPFPINPKKQKAKISANGRQLNGSLRLGEDGALEFFAHRNRSNPVDYDAHWSEPKPSEINIEFPMPVFSNEEKLRVGFLTAAYGLWFKHFGYSFILQSNLNIVREQILNPDQNIMNWNYLVEIPSREIKNPSIGLMKFEEEYFPISVIYDHIVLLPSARKLHPPNTPAEKTSSKQVSFGDKIAPRFQHRCVGPAVLICDGTELIKPDMIASPTVSPKKILIDGWS